jgi:hypothetical protein
MICDLNSGSYGGLLFGIVSSFSHSERDSTKPGQLQLLTAAHLLRRLLALVPPARTHLTSFHGVFAPNATLRPQVMLPPPKEPPQPLRPPPRDDGGSPTPPRRPRLDWATLQRRTFGIDVWTCACGGKRQVLAVITSRRTAEQLLENLGLHLPSPPRPSAQGPPQLALAV